MNKVFKYRIRLEIMLGDIRNSAMANHLENKEKVKDSTDQN